LHRSRRLNRVTELERKEDYLLDLAAEEGWPKDKLREKINAVRRERSDIERELSSAKEQLDAGRSVFYKALHLLDDPAGMYERGNEVVRTILNRAIFTKFMIDGTKVVGHQMNEPFDTLDETYQRRQARRYYRTVGTPSTAPDGLLGVPDLAELESRWHGLGGGCRAGSEHRCTTTPHPRSRGWGSCGTHLDRPARPCPDLAGQGF
jgi:hypothetical protein